MVYLVDPATGHLRFAHDAGIRSRRSRAWVRSIDLPVGVGIFGRAVAERAVVLTRDYLDGHRVRPRPRHRPCRGRPRDPLDGRGAAGRPATRSSARWAPSRRARMRSSRAQIGLVRALADHAAAAMHNVAADRGARCLALGAGQARADVERSLREIGARISAAADFPAVLQLAVDEAARLLDADGARIELVDRDTGRLVGAYASGALESSLIDRHRARRRTSDPQLRRRRPGGRHRPPVLDRRLHRATRASRACPASTATWRRSGSGR